MAQNQSKLDIICECPRCHYKQSEGAWLNDAIYDYKGRIIYNPERGDHTRCPECDALLHVDYDLIDSIDEA